MHSTAPGTAELAPARVPSFWTRHADQIIPFLFVVPALAYVGAFAFYPAYDAVVLSFRTPIEPFTTYNYTALVQQGLYTWIEDTVLVTAGALTIQIFSALFLASLMTQAFRGKAIFGALAILPVGIATVVGAFTFSEIFTIQGGYANTVLGYFGVAPIDWLHPASMALLSVIIADSWKNYALVMIILIAGYASIPRTLYLAAAMDGAGPLRRFVYITLPNLRGYLVIALLIRGAQEFNIFQLAYVMIGSNPQLLTVAVYTNWQDVSTYYLATAAATVLLGIISIFIVLVILLGGGGTKK
jgi:ABC-type sugar transport system permease subunit